MTFPVCFFAYNRPQHTRASLEALRANPLAADTILYAFCDGPAIPGDIGAVNEVRDVIRSTNGFREVRYCFSESNQGTAGMVVPGLTRVLSENDAAIMVEDDAVVSREFLTFLNAALARFAPDNAVMAVSGYMFRIEEQQARLPETFFYRKGTSFAWGTWRRAWSSMSTDCEALLAKLAECNLLERLDGDGAFRLSDILQRDAGRPMTDRTTSWSPRWFASMMLAGGLTLYPRRSLVRNIGFDGSGLRSPPSTAWDVMLGDFCPTVFPTEIREHPLAPVIMSACYALVDSSRPPLRKSG